MATIDFNEYRGLEVMLECFPSWNNGERLGFGIVHYGHIIGEYGQDVYVESSRQSVPMMTKWPLSYQRRPYHLHPKIIIDVQKIKPFKKKDISRIIPAPGNKRKEYIQPRFKEYEGKETEILLAGGMTTKFLIEGIVAKDLGPILILEDAMEKIPEIEFKSEQSMPCAVPSHKIKSITYVPGSVRFREFKKLYGKEVDVYTTTDTWNNVILVGEKREEILLQCPDEKQTTLLLREFIEHIEPVRKRFSHRKADLKLVVNNGHFSDENNHDPHQKILLENDLYALLRVNPWNFAKKQTRLDDIVENISL